MLLWLELIGTTIRASTKHPDPRSHLGYAPSWYVKKPSEDLRMPSDSTVDNCKKKHKKKNIRNTATIQLQTTTYHV